MSFTTPTKRNPENKKKREKKRGKYGRMLHHKGRGDRRSEREWGEGEE